VEWHDHSLSALLSVADLLPEKRALPVTRDMNLQNVLCAESAAFAGG
jgi:hypothetical protein